VRLHLLLMPSLHSSLIDIRAAAVGDAGNRTCFQPTVFVLTIVLVIVGTALLTTFVIYIIRKRCGGQRSGYRR